MIWRNHDGIEILLIIVYDEYMFEKLFLGICICWLFLWPKQVSGIEQNLIQNSSFEENIGTNISNWQISNLNPNNSIVLQHEVVHSGTAAVKIAVSEAATTSASTQISSEWFGVTPGAYMETSAWWQASEIKGVNVNDYPGWFYVRIRLQAYDQTKQIKIKDWSFGGQEGSINQWTQVMGNLIVPEEAYYMRMLIAVSYSTGTLWVDDVEVKEVLTRPQNNFDNLALPIIFPEPWLIKRGFPRQHHQFGLKLMAGDNRIPEEVSEYFQNKNLAYEFITEESQAFGQTQIIFTDINDPQVGERLGAIFPGKTLADAGDEGYFLSVIPDYPLKVIIAGNSETGRFYGFQTLKQLIADNLIYQVDILDKPDNALRGIPFPSQWWRNNDQFRYATGSAEMKYNFIWHQSGEFSSKLFTNWNLPFTESDLTLMRQYLANCRAHFIDCYFSFHPNGVAHPLIYSSETDINSLVNKMSVMYDQGVRGFGLSFDDLEETFQNKLTAEADILKFNNDIGLAHRYVISEVYTRLKNLHPDISFMIVPLQYQRTNNITSSQQQYLRTLSTLPPEIQIIACEYTDEDLLSIFDLTNRPALIWNNLYATAYADKSAVTNREPEYVVPFMSPIKWSDNGVGLPPSGFILLPRTYAAETTAGISWYSTADYAWSPIRYLPESAYQRAAAKYQHLGTTRSPDLTEDGNIDYLDYNLLINHFGQTGSIADLNLDGLVNILDYNQFIGSIF